VRVDDDRASALWPVVVHELSAELRRDEGQVDLRDVEGLVRDLADIPGIAGSWCFDGLRHRRWFRLAVPEEGFRSCRSEDCGSEEEGPAGGQHRMTSRMGGGGAGSRRTGRAALSIPSARIRCGPRGEPAGADGRRCRARGLGVSGYGDVIAQASKVAPHASRARAPSVIGLRASTRPWERPRLTPSAGAAAPLSRVLNDVRSGCLRVSGAVAPSAAGPSQLSPARRCPVPSSPERCGKPENSLAYDLKCARGHMTFPGRRPGTARLAGRTSSSVRKAFSPDVTWSQGRVRSGR
jgi:hypothetical protein